MPKAKPHHIVWDISSSPINIDFFTEIEDFKAIVTDICVHFRTPNDFPAEIESGSRRKRV
jgi:hypothetical protein